MTREKFDKAKDLVRDIDNLKKIIKTIEARHWVGFVCAEESANIFEMQSDIFDYDFETFIRAEKDKLLKELDKL